MVGQALEVAIKNPKVVRYSKFQPNQTSCFRDMTVSEKDPFEKQWSFFNHWFHWAEIWNGSHFLDFTANSMAGPKLY